MNKEWVFQHDNDPKHRTRLVTKWLDENNVKRIEWPSFSPDINPIEHFWDEMERRVKKESPKNERELKEALVRVWQSIPDKIFRRRILSILCEALFSTRKTEIIPGNHRVTTNGYLKGKS